MPITEAQREARRNHLGSSDVAAILGVDRFRNAYDVWLEKTGKLDEQKESPAMYAGTVFEDGVLQYAEKQLGKLIRNQYRSAKNLPIGANIDALIVESNEPVEAKTAGLYGPLNEEWGEDGTDQVPDRVLVQSHVHMLCVDKPVCHVAAFIGGRGFRLYQVPEDAEIKNIIAEKAIEFWDKHVKADIPPEDTVPSLAVVKRIRREPELIVPVPDAIVQRWQACRDAYLAAQKMKEAAEAELLAALGTAEGGTCSMGTITYLETHRKGYEVKPASYRVLRIKKSKGY